MNTQIKVSIITLCYNRESTIAQCIESVLAQDYCDIEYIIVDGASTDNSLEVINRYKDRITKIISEPDHGMYEALNKGIRIATGDVVGMLHSDDFFLSNHVISDYVQMFNTTDAALIYANGLFVDAEQTNLIIRNWLSGTYKKWKVRCGWLPLHPTVYIRREVINRCGLYDESYKIASDSDFLLRYLYENDLHVEYLNEYILKMRMGGLSTDSKRMSKMWDEDVRMFKAHHFFGVPEKILKMMWKIPQFIQAKFMRKVLNG